MHLGVDAGKHRTCSASFLTPGGRRTAPHLHPPFTPLSQERGAAGAAAGSLLVPGLLVQERCPELCCPDLCSSVLPHPHSSFSQGGPLGPWR